MGQKTKAAIQMDSDSEASFNSLFDEPQSNPQHHLPHKDENKTPHKTPLKSPLVAAGKKQKLTAPSPSKSNPITPPRQSTSNPTTPQTRIPASPAPVAKMVSSKRDLPKLSIPHSASTPTPRPNRENSAITTSSLIGESPTSSLSRGAKGSPSTSNQPTATSKTSPQFRLENHPTSPRTLTATSANTPQQTQLVENAMLKIFLHGHQGFRPLLLKDCIMLPPSQFFDRIMNSWSLPASSSSSSFSASSFSATADDINENTGQQLHITFPWLPPSNKNRLMILDRANIEAGLACLIHEVGNASAAASSRENTTHRSMMIEVTIFQTKQGLNDNEVFTNNPPSPKNTNARSPNLNTLKIYSNDRRSISTNANKIYSALIANAQAATRANAQTPLNPNGRGLRIQEISEMVGMEVSDVVVAGDELLEGGWILRGL